MRAGEPPRPSAVHAGRRPLPLRGVLLIAVLGLAASLLLSACRGRPPRRPAAQHLRRRPLVPALRRLLPGPLADGAGARAGAGARRARGLDVPRPCAAGRSVTVARTRRAYGGARRDEARRRLGAR